MWHKVWDQLISRFTLIAIDLRGYGRSSKPRGNDQHVNYSKRTMARDCVNVMSGLGYESFYICAHDRGARVAHQLLVDYPALVLKAILLDICPTAAMYEATNFNFAFSYYHWFFLIQPAPFPEEMILANPEAFLKRQTGRHLSGEGDVFAPEVYQSYLSMLKNPAAVHAMCEDYRAAASIDLEDQRQDAAQGKKIRQPMLILWGKKGVVQQQFDAIAEWKKVSDSSVEGLALDCGHYIPEEAPAALLEQIFDFFS